MGLFGQKLTYSEKTKGVIVGVSAVKVNGMRLPLAEYEVNGEKYQVRVPYDIAVVMETESKGEKKIVRANKNFGNSVIRAQVTGIQGCEVHIAYDPSKPNKGKVIGVL